MQSIFSRCRYKQAHSSPPGADTLKEVSNVLTLTYSTYKKRGSLDATDAVGWMRSDASVYTLYHRVFSPF